MGGSCLGSITSYFASLNVQLPKPPVSNLGIKSLRHCSGRHTGVQFTGPINYGREFTSTAASTLSIPVYLEMAESWIRPCLELALVLPRP